MAERSDGDGTLSTEQLLTGIGKLIYALNESVQAVDSRLEKMETGISTVLEERFSSVVSLLEETNGHLAGLAESATGTAVSTEGAAQLPTLDLTPIVDGLRTSIEELKASVETGPGVLISIDSGITELKEKIETCLTVPPSAESTMPVPELDLTPVVDGFRASVDELRSVVEAGPSALAGIDSGITELKERLDTGFTSLAAEMTGASGLVEVSGVIESLSGKLDELLSASAEIGSALSAAGESLLNGLGENSSSIVTVVEAVRDKIAGLDGVMINLSESMKSLGSDSDDALNAAILSSELEKITSAMDGSAGRLEAALAEALERSDGNLAGMLEDKLRPLVDVVTEIGTGLDSAGHSLEERLIEMNASTVEKVGEISQTLAESAGEQKESLERMSELLTLHSVELQDSNLRDLNRRAVVFFNNGEYDLAVGVLEEALELAPDSPELNANMAHVYAALGELDKSEESFRKALASDPEMEPAISGLGTLLIHAGRPDETIEFLSRFLQENTVPSVGVMLAMSRAYAATDRHSDAVSLLEKAAETAPGNPEIEQELARYREDPQD